MADGCLDVDETRLGAADIDEQGADDDLRFLGTSFGYIIDPTDASLYLQL